MADMYTIRYTSDSTTFEVQSPDPTWVDTKMNELMKLGAIQPRQAMVTPQPAVTAANPATPAVPTQPASSDQNLKASWSDDLSAKMDSYVDQRRKAFDKGTTKQAAIVAAFLEDVLGLQQLQPADLEFVYRELGWPTINHAAQLNNAYARDKYFKKSGGAYRLTHTGRVFGRDTAKD